jgi:hypothetical protein
MDDPTWYKGPPYAIPKDTIESFDKEQTAQPDEDEDEGINYEDIPQVTDFSQAKRVSDYGTVVDALRIRYQEKMARAAKVATEQKASELPSGTEPSRSFRRIRDYGGIENYPRLRVEGREKRTGKTLTTEDLP